MNPALIYWVVSGLAFLGILAVMGLLFWLAGRFL